MGVTAAVGISCALGGALIGGGCVAYYNHRQKEKERKQIEDLKNLIEDLDLNNGKVTAELH